MRGGNRNFVALKDFYRADTLDLTLLELVSVINEVTQNEAEVVATVAHMLASGRVRLRGNFRGQALDAA